MYDKKEYGFSTHNLGGLESSGPKRGDAILLYFYSIQGHTHQKKTYFYTHVETMASSMLFWIQSTRIWRVLNEPQ